MKMKKIISLLLVFMLFIIGTIFVSSGNEKKASALNFDPRNISISTLQCGGSIVLGKVETRIYCSFFNASKLKIEIVVERSSNNISFSEYSRLSEETTSKTYLETKYVKAEAGFYYRTKATATTYDGNDAFIESRSVQSGAIWYS